MGGFAAAIITGLYTLTAPGRQHEHERTLAREARVQERRADAYVSILEYAHGVSLWVERTEPEYTVGPPRHLQTRPPTQS